MKKLFVGLALISSTSCFAKSGIMMSPYSFDSGKGFSSNYLGDHFCIEAPLALSSYKEEVKEYKVKINNLKTEPAELSERIRLRSMKYFYDFNIKKLKQMSNAIENDMDENC